MNNKRYKIECRINHLQGVKRALNNTEHDWDRFNYLKDILGEEAHKEFKRHMASARLILDRKKKELENLLKETKE